MSASGLWLRFPARWGEYASSKDRPEHYWMKRTHFATPDRDGHRPLCWKTTFARSPTIFGGIPDDDSKRCGKCSRMEKNE